MAASEGALLARWIGRETLGTWRTDEIGDGISTAIAPFVFLFLPTGLVRTRAQLALSVLPVISG